MSKFHLPSQTPSATSTPTQPSPPITNPASPDIDSDDDLSTLPFATPLPRTPFLAQDFNPQVYLSSLTNRHQTLEDLRSDLRQRNQAINTELLDLVNEHWGEFLQLGEGLKGGDESVEGVRVGLLGFVREVEGVSGAVEGRAKEVGGLVEERRGVGKEVAVGRGLLEIEGLVHTLEIGMGVREGEGDEEDEDEDDDEDDDADAEEAVNMRRLRRHANQFILITRMIERIGSEHPFLVKQRPRVEELRKTLLLDLSSALRRAKISKEPDAILGLIKIYGDAGAETDAMKVLKAG